ncbi:hypothetical protein FKM82_023995 [Ascaphus truei]
MYTSLSSTNASSRCHLLYPKNISMLPCSYMNFPSLRKRNGLQLQYTTVCRLRSENRRSLSAPSAVTSWQFCISHTTITDQQRK